MKPKDHCATLGVARQAPPADIQRVYRKLALGPPAGDLFAVMGIAVPYAHAKPQKVDYEALVGAVADFDAHSEAAS